MLKDFTTGSIPGHMIRFMIPLLLSSLLQAVHMLIDAVWAGRMLGPSGVAVVSAGMPVIYLLSSFIIGIVTGAAILAGQAFGSKNRAALSDIVSTSAIATGAGALLCSAAGVVFAAPLLGLINTPAPVFHETRVFLSLVAGGMALGSGAQWFGAMMNAAGDSKTPFRVLAASLALNVTLTPVLIGGAGPLPALGTAGAAIATVSANAAALAVSLFVWRGHRLSGMAPIRFAMHRETLRKIAAVGFPLSLQSLIVSSSFLFIFALANRFGPLVTATFGIGSRVDHFSFLATFAMTSAVSAMTAQNIGAGRLERIPSITRWGLLFSLALAGVFSAAVALFPDTVTALFTDDRAMADLTRPYFRIAGASYLFLAVMFSFQGVMRGAGDTLPSFLIVAATMILLRVPLCYYLADRTPLKETGLWAGMASSVFVGMIAFWLYYVSGRWKERGIRTAAAALPE